MDAYAWSRGAMLVCDWILFIVLIAAGLYTGLMSLYALKRIFIDRSDSPDTVTAWLVATIIAVIAFFLVRVVGRRL